jgi:hypothetical protein
VKVKVMVMVKEMDGVEMSKLFYGGHLQGGRLPEKRRESQQR